LVGVVRQPRVDLDRHAAVDTGRSLPLRGQHVGRVWDLNGGPPPAGSAHVGAVFGELGDLGVVGAALGQRLLENRWVGGDTDDALGVDQLLQVAGLQTLPGQVVQPDRYSRGAQSGKVGILSHRISLRLVV